MATPIFPFSTSTPLPKEFGEQLFTNLQEIARRTRDAQRQRILDETSRDPRLAGAQQFRLREMDRDIADALLRTGSDVQLQGLREGLQDRRIREERDFTAGQAALDRALRERLLDKELETRRRIADEENKLQLFSLFAKPLLKEGLDLLLGSLGVAVGKS